LEKAPELEKNRQEKGLRDEKPKKKSSRATKEILIIAKPISLTLELSSAGTIRQTG